MWWTTSEQALSFLAHKLRLQDRRGQVLMSLAYHKAHVQEKGYADSLILAFLRGIKRTLWKLHVQFSWLKNKHKKQWTASGSVTLTLSWLSYTPVPALPQPTLFLTLCRQCVLFFSLQDCNCRQVPLPYPLTTLGTLHVSVPGQVLSPDWTWRQEKIRGRWLERISGPPDTEAEHRPLAPGLPDTWKPRPRPAVTHSICNPFLSV